MKAASGTKLTETEQVEWNAGKAVWEKVKAIREKSDALEAKKPIPADYADDKHWK